MIAPISVRAAKGSCSNCGRTVNTLRSGRCNPCYKWFRAHDEERPLDEDVRASIVRKRKLPDDIVRTLHARYMAGERITPLAKCVAVSTITLRRRFDDLDLERRTDDALQTCAVCGRKLQLNMYGICRSCISAASRYRCPRCHIVVPVQLGNDDMCDMCRDDAVRRAGRWRAPAMPECR